MDADTSRLLGALVRSRSVAALATLHEGRPFASMIPYALWHGDDGRLRFVTHVSRLSAHTRDMLESPDACLLITAPEPGGTDAAIPPQALPRVSVPVTAEFVGAEHPDHAALVARAEAAFAPVRYLSPQAYEAEIKAGDAVFRQLWKEMPWTDK